MVTLVDALMANYRMNLHTAHCKFPLAAAIALWPALAMRNGWEFQGPDYVARETIQARARMREHLKRHYRVKAEPA